MARKKSDPPSSPNPPPPSEPEMDKSKGWRKRLVLELLRTHPLRKHAEIAELFAEKSGEQISVASISKIKFEAKLADVTMGTGVLGIGGDNNWSGRDNSFERFVQFKRDVQDAGLTKETLIELIQQLQPLIALAGGFDNLVKYADAMK